MDLNGKTAIVTGASSGLGAAMGRALVERGAKVYGLARNGEPMKRLQAEVGEQFVPVALDLKNKPNLVQWLEQEFGTDRAPDILINNAGKGGFGKIDQMPEEEWNTMIEVNLTAMYGLTAQVVALMKRNTSVKHIINIGSILGTMGRADAAAYCATKYAVQGFSEALFRELRGDNIKVTCVHPGSIDTSFFQSSGIEAHRHMLQPQELATTIVQILETPDNLLVTEMTIRPLDPSRP